MRHIRRHKELDLCLGNGPDEAQLSCYSLMPYQRAMGAYVRTWRRVLSFYSNSHDNIDIPEGVD